MPELSGSTYSQIDGSNDQAAPNGMPEGMPPSGVNDAWRAGMGAVKRAYDRGHAGTWCTVGGTANAITLTYPVAPSGYVQGEKYAFKATAANTGATTVEVNGLGATNLFRRAAVGAAACAGGEIQNGDLVEIEYDGTQFQIMSREANSGVFVGGTLTANLVMSGAAINEARTTIASAATVNIGAAAANYLQVTGTTTITAFDTVQAGTERTLEFAGQLTLTHNATSLILPGAANITTAAGDTAIFRSEGSGNWRCIEYSAAVQGPTGGFVTRSDMQTASSGTKVVTPAHANDADGAAKASVVFNGTGTTGAKTLAAAFNVTSVTKNGTGDYTIAFTTPFASANYAMSGMSGTAGSGGGGTGILSIDDAHQAPTTSQVRINLKDITATPQDASIVTLTFYGRQ